MQTILIAAGGTGGHIFPALAIAKKLENNYHIIWLGSKSGMENSLVKDYQIFNVSAVGVRGKKIAKMLGAPLKIFGAILQTKKIIKQNKVDIVIGMGGFVGGIGGLATLFSRSKLIIHEQNSIAGTSNIWLNKISDISFQAFDGVLKNAITCGNPINFEQCTIKPIADPLKILVLGGSLGAKKINEVVSELQTNVNINSKIIHQVGKNNFASMQHLQTESYQIIDFIDDMKSAYENADVVIARSGAMTISELIYTQTPAILIPFPFAIDNHQVYNAKILVDKGCGIMIEEKELSAQKLSEALQHLTISEVEKMQNNFKKFKEYNTTSIIEKHINAL